MEPDRIDLDELLDRSQDAARRRAKVQAEQSAKREADNLRNDRISAVNAARKALELETNPTDWHRPTDDGPLARAVLLPLGDHAGHDVALAFTQRSVTLGGNVLTGVARAIEEEVWVASSLTVGDLADLEAVLDDAVARADRWDADSAMHADQMAHQDEALGVEGEDDRPEVVIAGPTIEAVLARALLELFRGSDPDA